MEIEGVLRMTYIKIERELLVKRLDQILKANDQSLILCSACGVYK